jgi:hypothetical protein
MVSAKGLLLSALGLVAPVLGVGISAAHASIIDVSSSTTDPGEFNSVTGGQDVFVSVSPAWAPAGVGYGWVSYASDTGCNTFVALTGICTPGVDNPAAVVGNITLTGDGGLPSAPTAVFFNDFVLPAGDSYSGTLSVWADDTARVYMNGVLLIDANPVLGNNCAGAPIGCVSGMDATFNIASLNLVGGSAGNILEIDAYQLGGGSPFGVMYDAAIDAEPAGDPAPEPASYVLMGLGLVAIGILIPRARRA